MWRKAPQRSHRHHSHGSCDLHGPTGEGAATFVPLGRAAQESFRVRVLTA